MSQGKWNDQHAVLKDLQEVCGSLSQEQHVYNKSLTEIRDKPPLSLPCEDDDETYNYMMGYRRGDRGDHSVDRNGYHTEPDLPSITHWLDQVKKTGGDQSNNYLDERSVFQSRKNPVEITKLNPTVPKVTSLDPTVKEFVPRAINSGKTCDIIPTTANIGSLKNNKTENVVAKVNVVDKIEPDEDKKCTQTCLQQKHSNDVQALKDKINKIPNTDSFMNKTERNIALSKLMQLLANPPVPKCNDTPVVKLLTPEHFVASVPEAPKRVPIINIIDPEITTPISSTIMPIATEELKDEQESPSRINESVKKVNDWFKQEEPVKKTNPKLHFAPPTYKRKEKSVTTLAVTNSTAAIRSSASSPSKPAYKKFVPSQQAEELYLKFAKDSEEKKIEKQLSIWENLERKLKEKDIEIRQKKLEESLSN